MKSRVETAKSVELMEPNPGSKYRSCEATGKRDECYLCKIVHQNGDESTAWLSLDYATSLENFIQPE